MADKRKRRGTLGTKGEHGVELRGFLVCYTSQSGAAEASDPETSRGMERERKRGGREPGTGQPKNTKHSW